MVCKRLLILMCLFSTILSVEANNQGTVLVAGNDKDFTVIAKGYGTGLTLAFAKLVAFNSIMPQLAQTQSLPGSDQMMYNMNGVVAGKGTDVIEGSLFYFGSWTLEDGVYTYIMEIRLRNMEEAEKPSE